MADPKVLPENGKVTSSSGDKFERIVEMHPAFDKRDPDPHKNYGIGGVRLRMILKGPDGATQFVLGTNWYLPHVTDELARKYALDPENLKRTFLPFPTDLGYHSPVPQYEGQRPMDHCDVLDGDCYYDGSSLNADRVYDVLLNEGSEGVWRELEELYNELFGGQHE